jgi:hypothetical protein
MNTRIQVVHGQNFDGGVVDPIPRPPAPAEAQKRALRDLILEALCTLEPKDREVQRKRDVLIGRRIEANKAAQELIEAEMVIARAELIEAHEEAKKAVRDHQKKIDALAKRIAEAQADLNVKKDAVARTMTVFRGATEDRKQLSRYATRDQSREADAAVEKAEKAVDKANAGASTLQQDINHMLLAERAPLIRERDALMAKELELAAAISGESYTNELGIVIPARPPL